jgi:hypothetical protein
MWLDLNGATSAEKAAGLRTKGTASAVPHKVQPVRALASEVRVSMLSSEHDLLRNNRTSAASKAHAREAYGTAESRALLRKIKPRKTSLETPFLDILGEI